MLMDVAFPGGTDLQGRLGSCRQGAHLSLYNLLPISSPAAIKLPSDAAPREVKRGTTPYSDIAAAAPLQKAPAAAAPVVAKRAPAVAAPVAAKKAPAAAAAANGPPAAQPGTQLRACLRAAVRIGPDAMPPHAQVLQAGAALAPLPCTICFTLRTTLCTGAATCRVEL